MRVHLSFCRHHRDGRDWRVHRLKYRQAPSVWATIQGVTSGDHLSVGAELPQPAPLLTYLPWLAPPYFPRSLGLVQPLHPRSSRRRAITDAPARWQASPFPHLRSLAPRYRLRAAGPLLFWSLRPFFVVGCPPSTRPGFVLFLLDPSLLPHPFLSPIRERSSLALRPTSPYSLPQVNSLPIPWQSRLGREG